MPGIGDRQTVLGGDGAPRGFRSRGGGGVEYGVGGLRPRRSGATGAGRTLSPTRGVRGRGGDPSGKIPGEGEGGCEGRGREEVGGGRGEWGGG